MGTSISLVFRAKDGMYTYNSLFRWLYAVGIVINEHCDILFVVAIKI